MPRVSVLSKRLGLTAGLFAKSAGFRSSIVAGTGMGADAMKVKQFNPAHVAPWRNSRTSSTTANAEAAHDA